MPTDRFTNDKATLRTELQKLASAGATITYGEAAKMVGRAAMGLGSILDAIGAEEAAENRPDLACLVVNGSTGFPGYVDETESERANALKLRATVFKVHGFDG